jgi:hypothetical protein
MGLSSKIGTFGRFEQGPFGKDRHFSKQIWNQAANSLLLSFSLTIDGDHGLAS